MWPLERTQGEKVDHGRRTMEDGHSTITVAHSEHKGKYSDQVSRSLEHTHGFSKICISYLVFDPA